MVNTAPRTKQQAAEATPLVAGIAPPPGLRPPGLSASACKKAIRKLEAELFAPPGLETIAEDDDSESTADGTSPTISDGAAESIIDSETPQVRVVGLPNELLSDLMFQAVLQQAHLKGLHTGFLTRHGDRCGEAVINFVDESAAEWCVQHFHGRRWAADGRPVEAHLLTRGKAAHEAGPFTVGQLVEFVGLVSRDDLNGLCGIITSWDAAAGRWTVVLSSGEPVQARPANLVASSTEAAANDTSEEPWLEAWFQGACDEDISQFGDAQLDLFQAQNYGCGLGGDVERHFEGFSADAPAFVPSSAGADSVGLSAEALVFVPGEKSVALDQKITSTSEVSTVDGESESDSEKTATRKEAESDSEKTAIEAVA